MEEAAVAFRLNVSREGATTEVAPIGEVDVLTARTLYDELIDQLREDLAEMVIDFAGVTFIDTTGLAALVKAARRLGRAGATMRIANASPHAVRVLSITGVDRTIPVDAAT